MKPTHSDYHFSTKVLNSMDGKGLMDLHDKYYRTPYHKLKNTKNTRSELQDKILRKAYNYSEIYNKLSEAKEKQEYDYEGDMAMSQLKSIIANAQRIHDMLERDTNIPEWVQSKITLAEDYITTAANYMQGEMKEEVATNSIGAGNVAGLQGEPPVNKKKKNVMSFNRFMKK